MTIECYDTQCVKHCFNRGGEGPFCDEDRCVHELAPELWAAAQLAPGECIEDGVARIVVILKAR